MKTGWALAYGVICGMLGAGVLAVVVSPPPGEPIQLIPPPTAAPIRVHVAGGVLLPGVYELQRGSRIEDAVLAAGGLLPDIQPQSINLAAHLEDGDQVVVPLATRDPIASGVAAGDFAGAGRSVPPAGGILVDINTAMEAELESLPGIGPVTAAKIVAHRQEFGPFPFIEAIQDVAGIGPATFDRIKDRITAGPTR